MQFVEVSPSQLKAPRWWDAIRTTDAEALDALAQARTAGASYLALAKPGALEAAGVEFIAANGGGPGVRLRKI